MAAQGSVPTKTVDDQQIYEYYGSEFIGYALNGHPLHVPNAESGSIATARSILAAILAGQNGEEDAYNKRLQVLMLLSTTQEDGLTLAQSLRTGTGGAVPTVQSGDPVVSALTKLAHRIFPLLTIPRGDSGSWPGPTADISLLFHTSPNRREALAAILSDRNLKGLFPNAPDVLPDEDDNSLYDIATDVVWSNGSGGGVQLVMLPVLALAFAFATMRIEGLSTVSCEDAVNSTVALMRKLAIEHRGSVPVVVGISQLELQPGRRIDLHGCKIISSDALQGVIPPDEGSTTAFLVLNAELTLLDVVGRIDGAPEPGATPRRMEHRLPAIQAAARALDREIVRARLAIALGSPQDGPYTPAINSRWLLNPFMTGGTGWPGQPSRNTFAPRIQIDDASAARINEWSERLAHLPDSIWLGARRVVGAIADRIDPLDAFVDAVVCWENLLGADSEVTFRLCGALAMLLEPDVPDARIGLFKELRDLYSVRSGLVHGSREPSGKDAAEYRRRAITVALSAIRAIFDRPDLLDAASSTERNRRVMLGA